MARNNKATFDYPQTIVFNLGTKADSEKLRINIMTKGNSMTEEAYSAMEATLVKKFSESVKFLEGLADVGLTLTMKAPYDPDADTETSW